LIDDALLRPGRIDSHIELTVPDSKTREKIFEVHAKNMPVAKNVDLKSYVVKTDNWTGADIQAFVREAGMYAIKNNFTKKEGEKFEITKDDFEKSYKDITKMKQADTPQPSGLSNGMPSMDELSKMMPQEEKPKAKKGKKKQKSSQKK
jgi:transitional endoplasmic reticulum ATPase